jgi:hypothetical protein
LLQELLREDVDAPPPLRTIIETARAERRPFWPWLLAAAVLAGAAVLSTFVLDELSSTRLPSPVPTPAAPATDPVVITPPQQAVADDGAQAPDDIAPAADDGRAAAAVAADEPVRTAVEAPDRPDPAAPSTRDAATAVAPQAGTTLLDAVPAGPRLIGLQPESLTGGEGQGVARLAVVRTGPLDRALEVRWWTEPGEAMAEDDYADFGARIERFAPGQSRVTLLIPIVADAVREATETFAVVIAASENQTRLAARRATIIVVDDD